MNLIHTSFEYRFGYFDLRIQMYEDFLINEFFELEILLDCFHNSPQSHLRIVLKID